ncbi:MAG: hypothetical protein K9M80_01865 [Candidatus Marinimicrobia bacterium]|nr:hypothetical protein [Candidatus Neomarinimicrobiota bacterium]
MHIRASSRKYKKEKMYLGIKEENGRFITGQEKSKDRPDGLTQQEIMNPDLIPNEKRKKYSFVITPDTYISIHDGQKIALEGENQEDDALWGLLKLQPNVAINKAEHNPAKHDWYIEDPIKNEEVKRKVRSFKHKATTMVDEATTSRQTTFLIYASNEFGRVSHNPRNMTPDRIYNTAYDIAEEYPEKTIEFFENKNTSIKKKTAVLELISYEIITKRNDQYFDGPSYMGSNLKELLDYLEHPEHAATRDKLFKMLNKKKTGSKDFSLTQEESESSEAAQYIKEAKIAFADDNIDKAQTLINEAKTKKMNPEVRKDFENIFQKIFEKSTMKDTADLSEDFGKANGTTDEQINQAVPNIEMTKSEIIEILRSKPNLKGWDTNMSKQKLVDFYHDNN